MAKNYLDQVKGKSHRFIIEDYPPISTAATSTNLAKTVYYRGTSEYYLKGRLRAKAEQKPGDVLRVKVTAKSPLLFEVSR